MTEKEFKALLKVQGDDVELKIEEEIVYTAMLIKKDGVERFNYWANSTNKEAALENLALQYFIFKAGEKDADIR